jgi:cyclopropane-fatty-acyl-phospholipid synthase
MDSHGTGSNPVQAVPDSPAGSSASPTADGMTAARSPERGGPTPSGLAWVESWLLRQLFRALGNPPFRAELWNEVQFAALDQPPIATVRIHDRPTLWKLFADPLYQFGEAYSNGRLEVEGKLVDFLVHFGRAINRTAGKRIFHLRSWLHKPRGNSLAGSQENIQHHYDIGSDFFKIWLDDQLVYTGAYFPDQSYTLEQAQVAKMDHVCRKLWLRPGETVIEAGCGWGALALHMARYYGVSVKAYNICKVQIQYARERAKAEELQDRVEFIEGDWRTIDRGCDVFVSIGMLEHVGLANYRRLGNLIQRCLKPDGRGLIHTIGQNKPIPLNPWIERRIFPGAYPPTLDEIMEIFQPCGFSVLDVENLRLHYAETLRHWLQRFEAAVDKVINMFDERFVRMWRLYLSGSVAAFETSSLQLFQVLFAPELSNRVPRSRQYQYGRSEWNERPGSVPLWSEPHAAV